MTKEQKTTAIIITASVLFVALVAFILWRMYQKSKEEKDYRSDGFPLQKGSLGNEVKTLQEYLNAKIDAMEFVDGVKLAPLKEDGIFGPKTAAACRLILGVESVSESRFVCLINGIDE